MNAAGFRAPAVPLITHDPFFSVWSCADELTGDVTRHWDGTRKYMFGVLIVDGIIYEFLGKVGSNQEHYYAGNRILKQTGCEVRPLSTVYTFEHDLFDMKLTFTSPLLMNDLKLLSRPISYISYEITPKDGKEHTFEIQFGFSAEFCVNSLDQQVHTGVTAYSMFFSSGTEMMLKRSGDDHRIEWGELHVIAPEHAQRSLSLRVYQQELAVKYGDKNFPINIMNSQGPRREQKGPENFMQYEKASVYPYYPTIVVSRTYTTTYTSTDISDHIALGYNDIKSIRYFGEDIDAYWKKDGDTFFSILGKSVREYDEIMAKVAAFEEELLEKANKISPKYADIISLAYRQAVAGHKLTFHGGELQFFSKENYSNGCIATVDVTYPSVPLFLMYAPELVEGMLNPVFRMIDIGMWNYEFAPHDVGQYPIADGQLYGFSQVHRRSSTPLNRQMPVEECGNMILCVAGICHAEKNMDYFMKHKDILLQWADYLVRTGFNPGNQLCTDDFAGHLAHNVNLSAKAICAVGAMAQMLENAAKSEEMLSLAAHYRKKAEEMASSWMAEALETDAGEGAAAHYRLAFDQPNTWSLKYNMVWDKVLNLGLFSKEVYERELACYKAHLQEYGIPLDCRGEYTKTDWEMWTTALFDDKEYTDAIVNRMWQFLCDTPERAPFTDLPYTTKPWMRSFQARTVQGGLFINML